MNLRLKDFDTYLLECTCGHAMPISCWSAGAKLRCPHCSSELHVPELAVVKTLPRSTDVIQIPLNWSMLKFWTGFSLFLASAVLFVDVEYAGLSGIALSILLLIVAAAMSLCFRAAQPKEKLTFELDGVLIPKVGFVQWSEIAEIQTEKVHYITVLTVDGKKHHVSWIYLGKGWESILQFHREYA